MILDSPIVTGSIVVSGSTIFGSSLDTQHQLTGSLDITGSLILNGNNVILSNQTSSISVLSASYSETSSLSLNSELLEGYDSTSFILTSSYNDFTASYLIDSSSFSSSIAQLQDFSSSLDSEYVTEAELQAVTSSLSGSISYLSSSYLASSASFDTRILTNSSSISLLSGSYLNSSSSFDSRIDVIESNYVTTGSNTFVDNQTISGSLVLTGSVTSSRVLTDAVRFNTSAGVSVGVGELAWNNSDGTLDLGMKGGNVVQQIGQATYYEVRNDTVSVIPKGTAVYADGVTASGGRITAAPYTADGSIREVRFLGLAAESISTGINGFVTHFGYVRGLDTRGNVVSSIAVGDETWAVGDILYVHPTVAGKLTNVAPEHEIIVAIIINRHQSAGVIFVRPSSGGHLEDLHDITINTGSLTNGQVLAYNSTSGLWENTNQINTSSFATTGSNTFVGNQIITGSLEVTNGITSSFVGDGSGLTNIPISAVETSTLVTTSSFNSYTSSANIRLGSLETYSSSLNSAFSLDSANVTVLGNFKVQGSTTIIDSTTIQLGDNIIELNGTGAASAGLLVKDITAPNNVSGSFLWNATTDRWTAGPLGSESNVLLAIGDNVVSGSSQITAGSTTNFSTDVKTQLNNNTVISGSSQVFSNVSGDITIASNGVATIAANSVALGTDTTGNYVASLVAGTNITLTNNTGEGATPTIGLTNNTISGKALGTNLDTLTIGTGLSGTSYNGSSAVTIANTGVTSNVAGTGISVSSATGAVTITNSSPNATHTGDVTGATALTIANDAVTNAKAANMAVNTIKGRITTGTGDPEDLTAANVRTIINVADGATANTGTVTSVATNNGLTGGTITTTGTIGLTGQALALHNLATNGVIARTNTGTVAARTITASTGISVSNGNGVSGNPTITNTGVTSNVAGTGISVSGATGAVTISIGQAVATSSNVQFNSLGVGTAGSGVTGEIRATADVTAFYSSDERLKEDITPINNPIEKLMAINGVTFNWKEGFETLHSHVGPDTGVIAQEIETIELPGVVITRDTGYKAVNYEKLSVLLIEGFKVQQTLIYSQQSQIDELKTLVNQLLNK